jgi:hypothetical protein
VHFSLVSHCLLTECIDFVLEPVVPFFFGHLKVNCEAREDALGHKEKPNRKKKGRELDYLLSSHRLLRADGELV